MLKLSKNTFARGSDDWNKKDIDISTTNGYHVTMNVVEDDNMIQTILMDEYAHCQEMIEALQKSIADCPKGKLSVREKVNKKSLKIYHYYSLKFRENNKVFNLHISESKLPEIQNLLEKRMKLIEETKPYKNRVRYIEKILGISRNKHSGKNITS